MHYLCTVKKLTFLIAAFILSSCSDGSLQESGGGSGDESAFALIQPFAGLYDLQDDWQGEAGDQAFLSIREPNSNGVAEAILFDIDDTDNCILTPAYGEVSLDPRPTSNSVFLNDILDLNESVLTLSVLQRTLTIELADEIDRDGDNDLRELVQLTAERVDITEMDIGSSCF